MKRLLIVALLTTSATVFAQNRSAELDKAYEEARAAAFALQEAEKRRDQGVEVQARDRSIPRPPAPARAGSRAGAQAQRGSPEALERPEVATIGGA
jgi:hypothetical protein